MLILHKLLLIIILVIFFIADIITFAIKKVLDEWEYDEFLISGEPPSKILRNQMAYIKDVYRRKTC